MSKMFPPRLFCLSKLFQSLHSSFPLQIKSADKGLLLFLLTWLRKGLRVMRGPFVRLVRVLCVHVFLWSFTASWTLRVFTSGELRAAVERDCDTFNYTKVVGYDAHSKEVKIRKPTYGDIIAFRSHKWSCQGYNKADFCGKKRSRSALFNVIKVMVK